MQSILNVASWVLGLALVGWGGLVALLAVTVRRGVLGMLSDQARLELADPDVQSAALEKAAGFGQVCDRLGMEFIGAYRMTAPNNPGAFLAVWKTEGMQRYGVFYLLGAGGIERTNVDFVTLYEGGGLTTTRSVDAMLFPRPAGSEAQAFPGLSDEELHERHAHAERFLAAQGRRVRTDGTPFERILFEETRRGLNHVRTYPLWPVRAVLWYVTRAARANRPVAG